MNKINDSYSQAIIIKSKLIAKLLKKLIIDVATYWTLT
jgi:hypothetical protein